MGNDLCVTGIRLQKLSYLEKKALNPHCFVLIDLKTERSTWSFIAQNARVSLVAYLHVLAAFITKEKSLGWSKTSKRKWTFEFVESIGRKDELNIHRWKENNVTYWSYFRMTLKWKRANKTEKTNEWEQRFDWFIERIQTRVAFGRLSEGSSEKTSCPRTF